MAAVTCPQVFTESSTGRGRREISADPSGKRRPISRRVELHEDSQRRVGHIQEVTPERTSWGSESRVGAGLVPQGGAGAAGGPTVTQGPGGWNHVRGPVGHPPPACGFQGACRPAHWRPRGLCAPSWNGCRGWQLPERSPPSLSGLGLWKKGLRPGRTGGAVLQRPQLVREGARGRRLPAAGSVCPRCAFILCL